MNRIAGSAQRRSVADLARDLEGIDGGLLHDRLRELLPGMPLGERFELLHRLGVYHHPESMSGAASTMRETRRLREALPEICAAFEVRRLLDVPCGDFHWMRELELEVDYVGVDVVPDLVERNRRLYERPGRRFVRLDATVDPLPEADLVLCRDLIIHLSLDDIRALLSNFVASGSRLLLISQFGDRDVNGEILSGDFHAVNLCRAPFHLPPPLRLVIEESELAGGAFPDRALGLWNLADVRRALLR